MTAKELLNPRYELIAPYPNMNFKVGTILTYHEENNAFYWIDENKKQRFISNASNNFKGFEHLFRKMNWWEKRTKDEMPKKLVLLQNKDYPDFDISKEKVFHIEEWDMKKLHGFISVEKRIICSLNDWLPEYGYIPVD